MAKPDNTVMPMSMTGFARVERQTGSHRWAWELRSVNGKGLEVRFRLPAGFDEVEAPARQRVAAALGRGNVQASLTLASADSAGRLRVNEAVLRDVLAAVERIRGALPSVAPASMDGILGVRGVLDFGEEQLGEAARAELVAAMMAGLEEAVAGLKAVRLREGAALAAVLRARLDDIERLCGEAERSPARTAEAIRARLKDQVEALLGASPALDPQRLHQEAVLLATRADIREELDRLAAHVAAAREMLAKGGPIGRQLDFLAQEFNREANTLCSKSNDSAITAIGLELKVAVDQFREQVQNLE
jgi:uncharacterized protein (TIGR00255 family)